MIKVVLYMKFDFNVLSDFWEKYVGFTARATLLKGERSTMTSGGHCLTRFVQ